MIILADISAASRVLPCYDGSEAYLFDSFARGQQTLDSDIDSAEELGILCCCRGNR